MAEEARAEVVQALEAGREETREFVSWRAIGGSMHVALHKQTLSVGRLIQDALECHTP